MLCCSSPQLHFVAHGSVHLPTEQCIDRIEMAFCESCLTFPKAWEIQMGDVYQAQGWPLFYFLADYLGTARSIKPKPFWRLGSRQASGCSDWSLAAALALGQAKLFWQTPLVAETPCVTVLSVEQCLLTARWDVLEGSSTGCS